MAPITPIGEIWVNPRNEPAPGGPSTGLVSPLIYAPICAKCSDDGQLNQLRGVPVLPITPDWRIETCWLIAHAMTFQATNFMVLIRHTVCGLPSGHVRMGTEMEKLELMPWRGPVGASVVCFNSANHSCNL
jgi:hypothetical protein